MPDRLFASHTSSAQKESAKQLLRSLHKVWCRWARKGTAGSSKEPSDKPAAGSTSCWEDLSCAYSRTTLKSLELVDETLVNYDLLEALVVHIVDVEAAHGPGALLRVTPLAITIPLIPACCSAYRMSTARACLIAVLMQWRSVTCTVSTYVAMQPGSCTLHVLLLCNQPWARPWCGSPTSSHFACMQQCEAEGCTLQDWADAPEVSSVCPDAKAILIFMPGAPEIARLVRLLESSPRLRQAAQGRLQVLPLHGALPSHAQVPIHRHTPRTSTIKSHCPQSDAFTYMASPS